MKHFIALLLILFSQQIYSQSFEWNLGMNYNVIKGSYINEDNLLEDFNNSGVMAELGIGYVLPVIKINDDKSLAIRASLLASKNVYESYNARTPILQISLRAPAYISYNIGAGATKKSKDKFGFSMGAGYTYRYDITEIIINETNKPNKFQYGRPSLMFEFSKASQDTASRYRNFKIRFDTQLGDYKVNYFTDPYEYHYAFKNFALSLIVIF